jgi:hypothetical protein
MKIDEIIKRLEYYNEWRRGADTEMPRPKEIGKTIDAAIKEVKKINKKNNDSRI